MIGDMPRGLAILALTMLLVALAFWYATAPDDTTGQAPVSGVPLVEAGPAVPGPGAPGLRPARPAPLSEPERLAASPAPQPTPGDAGGRRTFPVEVSVFRFVSPASVPAAGARIELGVSPFAGPRGEVLATLESDASGRASVELPFDALAALGDVRGRYVWARSSGEGLLTQTAARPAPAPGDAAAPPAPGVKPVELRLSYVPGVVVEGRVVDAQGRPVAASVSLGNDTGAPMLGRHVGRTDAEGRFRLDAAAEGPSFVRAQARSTAPANSGGLATDQCDLGTGISAGFDVRFDTPPPFVEVVVSGPGALRGTVRDDQGQPVAGLDLLVLVAELDDGRGGARLPQPRANQLDREGRGHIRVTTRTDAEGAFQVLGLRADLYTIRAQVDDGDLRGGHPVGLTPDPVPSQGQLLDLRLTRP